jgi:hypothetical protein
MNSVSLFENVFCGVVEVASRQNDLEPKFLTDPHSDPASPNVSGSFQESHLVFVVEAETSKFDR